MLLHILVDKDRIFNDHLSINRLLSLKTCVFSVETDEKYDENNDFTLL